jgi:hypothetical protein
MGEYHDPVTGDVLTRLEYLTRKLQVMVRTPAFMLVFNLITVTAMVLHRADAWNYFASWLAIVIEWVVGTYMFGQTARDAQVIREVRELARVIQKHVIHEDAVLEDIEECLEMESHDVLSES